MTMQTETYPSGSQGGADVYQEKSLSFSTALEALKKGRRIAREGWNGKGMWLTLVQDKDRTVNYKNGLGADYAIRFTGANKVLPWIGMYTADTAFVPWLASQTDMLADDWEILE
jgi:hypothetical protein